jgi:DNA (cytosine-5)-methyltransferase 1
MLEYHASAMQMRTTAPRVHTPRFIDLFAGLGGFHLALSRLGFECVLASEIDPVLRGLYSENFPNMKGKIVGDIRDHWSVLPEHDVLAAGFPCQPFSKSGSQMGAGDPLRGTLHNVLIDIIAKYRPQLVILENVGNFERHGNGKIWHALRSKLAKIGYFVHATGSKIDGGTGLISPHHFGFQQKRDRFYVVCSLHKAESDATFEGLGRFPESHVAPLLASDLPLDELAETALSVTQLKALRLWQEQIDRLRAEKVQIPTFPIWIDEFDSTYPYEGSKLKYLTRLQLADHLPHVDSLRKSDFLSALPSYIRTASLPLPSWKVRHIERNRAYFADHRWLFPSRWIRAVRALPSSYRKLEWNCKDDSSPFFEHTFQFRPSGVRVSSASHFPALIAMTSTQTPIVGSQLRYLARSEALILQGFPPTWQLPKSRSGAMKAVGNAVHSGVAQRVIEPFLHSLQPPSYFRET